MIAYLDSSVFLRVLFNQKNSLKEFKSIEKAVSSRLLAVECKRTIERLHLEKVIREKYYLTALEQLNEALFSIEIIEISESVLSRASEAFSFPIGTLDAIHLSSALIWKSEIQSPLVMLTHDKSLRRASQSVGLEVLG